MREIRITVENEEFEMLKRARRDENRSWKAFFLDVAEDRIRFNEAAEDIVEGNLVITGNLVVKGDITDG